jgi:hypothetical protein
MQLGPHGRKFFIYPLPPFSWQFPVRNLPALDQAPIGSSCDPELKVDIVGIVLLYLG